MHKLSAAIAAGLTALLASTILVGAGQSLAEEEEAMSPMEQGKALAFDRKKGNCLACHMIEGGDLAGTTGPPLLAMQMRYPDKAVLRAQIWDATEQNPATVMPPFGRHMILTEEEIDLVTEFVYSL